MSSMVRNALIAALTVSAAFHAAPALAQDGRTSLVASQSSAMSYAVSRWEQLQANPNYSFEDYASFLLAYPGFPDEDKLKGYAEARLGYEWVDPNRVLTYFAAEPPVTNAGRAQQALVGSPAEHRVVVAVRLDDHLGAGQVRRGGPSSTSRGGRREGRNGAGGEEQAQGHLPFPYGWKSESAFRRVSPLGSLTETMLPSFEPSRIGWWRIVTLSPGFRLELFHPLRAIRLGAWHSKPHSSIWPATLGTLA